MSSEESYFVIRKQRAADLYFSSIDEEKKLTYYLASATLAAIGFAITQTIDKDWGLDLIPAGIAILFWAISFVTGVAQRRELILSLESGADHFDGVRMLGIPDNMTKFKAKKAVQFSNIQLISFIIGVVSYLVYHILQMIQKSGYQL